MARRYRRDRRGRFASGGVSNPRPARSVGVARKSSRKSRKIAKIAGAAGAAYFVANAAAVVHKEKQIQQFTGRNAQWLMRPKVNINGKRVAVAPHTKRAFRKGSVYNVTSM